MLVAVEMELVYGDGSVVLIERTSLDHLVRRTNKTMRHRSLVDAIRWTEALPVDVASALYTATGLASLLAQADRLMPRVLVLNGQPWGDPGTAATDHS